MTLYEEIANDLRRRLTAGEFPVGSEFLGIWKVQQEYGVSDGTAHRALKVLHDAGEIEMRQGLRNVVRRLPRTKVDLLGELRSAQAALTRVIEHLETIS